MTSVNRVALIAVLAGAIFAASAFFLLLTGEPDDVGDGATPDAAAVAGLPPKMPESRDTTGPPPAPPSPPPAPRRRTPGAAGSASGAAGAGAAAAVPANATLRVVSDVPGAQVFLDRRFIGATPVQARDLTPGEYQLNVSAAGYDNHVATLSLTPGDRQLTIIFREVRLDASLDVVHKHRLGSCQGTLVATPHGLRYDTADRDDVFRAPLLELEAFEIDYLAKNLRVQPRKGRRYDFTVPDGHADRLLVFHRDVERARERLKNGEKPAAP